MYELSALLAKHETLLRHVSVRRGARVVPLAQSIAMIPLTDALHEALRRARETAPAEPASSGLEPALEAWAQGISQDSAVAYVEAGYAGGIGGQKAVVWTDGQRVLGPLDASDAINQSLRLLGVSAEGTESDEFDAIGLGAHRHTEKWI